MLSGSDRPSMDIYTGVEGESPSKYLNTESRMPTVKLMFGCMGTKFETKIMLVLCSLGGGGGAKG